MTALLVSHRFRSVYGDAFLADAQARGVDLELLVLPDDPEARLADDLAARAEVAYFSSDVFPKFGKAFFSATRKAPGLKWLHVFNAGVDHPVFASILERGVRLTTSSGTASTPIAQTAIAGMLYLQRDLAGKTLLVYGFGKIGAEIARLARLLEQRATQAGSARSAADDWFLASLYHTISEHFIPPADPARLASYGEVLRCFERARASAPFRLDRVEVPFEGGHLPAYWLPVQDVGSARRATAIFICGLDTTKELWFLRAREAFAERGINALWTKGGIMYAPPIR